MSPVSLRLNVGSRLPIHRTAMGLAYLAETEPDLRASIIAELIAAEPDKKASIRQLVDTAGASYRQHRFVGAFGMWHSYINAVGVAFRPTDGSPLVAITCGGIVDIVPKDLCLASVGPDLVRLTQNLRAGLAGQPVSARDSAAPPASESPAKASRSRRTENARQRPLSKG